MSGRSPQTQMKRARELALKERRERKREKKAARAAERRDAGVVTPDPTDTSSEP